MNKNIFNTYQDYDGYYKYNQEIAGSYEESRKIEQHWQKENLFIENYFKKRKINKLLDIPVGTGRFFSYYNNVETIIGVDVSEAMIIKAQEKLSLLSLEHCIKLEQGDVFNLRFENCEFDCIVVFRLFHLMPEESLKYAIQELCRVASKDIIVQSYVKSNKIRRLLNKIITNLNKYKYNNKIIKTNQLWSHIQAYYHSQNFLDSEFKKHNFFPGISKLLDIYGNCDVRATVYSKKP